MLETVQNYVQQYVVGPTEGQVRLNIMCGLNVLEGWINIDPFFREHPTIKNIPVLKMDPRRLDFPDNSVDEIASVSLEHIPHTETLAVLSEWMRVLKPGGTIDCIVPEAEWNLRYWLSLPEEERWGNKLANLQGLQDNAGQVHYTLFTPQRMKTLFEAIGFINVETKLEWSYWTETQKLRGLGTKPETAVESAELQPKYWQSHTSVTGSPIDEGTDYFLGNPLPNVDYEWIHNKVMIPRWKQQIDVLSNEARFLKESLKLQNEVAAMEKQQRMEERKHHLAEIQSLNEKHNLQAESARLEKMQLIEERNSYKAFHSKVKSLPLVHLAVKFKKALTDLT